MNDIIQKMPAKYDDVEDLAYKKLTERQKFKKLNDAEQLKANREHVPYCYRAAKRDFIALQEAKFAKYGSRVADYADNVKIEDFDFKKYWDVKNFKFIEKTQITEQKLLDGMRVGVHTGYYYRYKWKDGGYGVDVMVPKEVDEQRQKKK